MRGPIEILREAIRAVPAVKYALAVAGVAAALAVIKSFRLGWQVAAVGVLLMLVLMTALVLFANFVKAAPGTFQRPVQVFVWFALLMLMALTIAVFSTTVFGVLPAFRQSLGLPPLPNRPPSSTSPSTASLTPTITGASTTNWAALDRKYHFPDSARAAHETGGYSYFLSKVHIDKELAFRELEISQISVSAPGIGRVLPSQTATAAAPTSVGFDLEVHLSASGGDTLAGQKTEWYPPVETIRQALGSPVQIDGKLWIDAKYSALSTLFWWKYSVKGSEKAGGPTLSGLEPVVTTFNTGSTGLAVRIFAWTRWGDLCEFELQSFDVQVQGRQRPAEN